MKSALALALCLLTSPAYADYTPHARLHVGKPKPAPVTKIAASADVWLNGEHADLSESVIQNFAVYTRRSGIRISNGSHDIVIRDGDFYLTSTATAPNLPVAVEVRDGHDILIENVTAHDFKMFPVKGKYLNGDCFSGERASHDVTLRHTHAIGCSDGGYDFKTDGVHFDDVTVEDAGYCFRLWGKATITTASCSGWRKPAGVQVMPNAVVTIELLKFPSVPGTKGAAFQVRKGATLTVKACEGVMSAGETWLQYYDDATPENTHVTLGPSCGDGGRGDEVHKAAPPADDAL